MTESTQPQQVPQPQQQQQAPQKPRQKRKDDFNLLNVLGRGAFGQVIEVEDKENKKHYAMKILSKNHIIREKKMNYVKVERDVMTKLNHPNIVRLLLTFQDPSNLYYVVELGPHGDLQNQLNKLYSIDVDIAKLLLGQVLLAIAHMHQHRIIHRDLKPENILLDDSNRVKITDFGTSKIFGASDKFECERSSFVGSADYVSPEILNETAAGPASDLWSYGCLIYSILVGYAPYHTDSNYATFMKIQSNEYELPEFLPETAKDLIQKMLKLDPKERLGFNSYDDNYSPIRNHPFFAGINWDELPKRPTGDLRPFAASVEARDQKIIQDNAGGNGSIEELLEEAEEITTETLATFINPEGVAKKVHLVLTNKKRLVIVNIRKTKLKAEVPIVKELKIGNVDDVKIRFVGTGVFFFIVFASKEEADEWVERIRELLAC